MTESAENITLSREQLKNILAAARDNAPVDEVDVETFDYDWTRPHQFSDSHHLILSQFLKQLSGDFAEMYSSLCNDPSRVTIPRIREYYCNGLRQEFCEEKKNYYMVFADGRNREIGVLVVPYLAAIQWTSKMLGDTAPDITEEYVMSNLEESLLIDFSNSLIARFSESLVKHELGEIKTLSVLSDRDWPIECLDYDEYSLLQLNVEHSEDSAEAYLFISSSHFGSMLEIIFPDAAETNPQEVKEAVIESLNKIPIEVDALVGKATVAVSNIMGLVEGDVIMLDRKVNEPIEALIESKVFFHGHLAKSTNRYALAVSDMVEPGDEVDNQSKF